MTPGIACITLAGLLYWLLNCKPITAVYVSILEDTKQKSKKKPKPSVIKRRVEMRLHGGEDPISAANIRTSHDANGECLILEDSYGRIQQSIKDFVIKNAEYCEGCFYEMDADLEAIEDIHYSKWVVSPRTTQEIAASLEKKSHRQQVKVKAVKSRRRQFQINKARLTLLLLDAGSEYICNHPGCEIDEDLTIDHIYPLSRGGDDSVENLQFLCRRHNSQKGDKIQ